MDRCLLEWTCQGWTNDPTTFAGRSSRTQISAVHGAVDLVQFLLALLSVTGRQCDASATHRRRIVEYCRGPARARQHASPDGSWPACTVLQDGAGGVGGRDTMRHHWHLTALGDSFLVILDRPIDTMGPYFCPDSFRHANTQRIRRIPAGSPCWHHDFDLGRLQSHALTLLAPSPVDP